MWGIAAAAFIAIFAFDTPFPPSCWRRPDRALSAAALAAGVRARRRARQRQGRHGPALIDDHTPTPPHARFSRRKLAKVLAGGRPRAVAAGDGAAGRASRAGRAR
jgi:chromate transporter